MSGGALRSADGGLSGMKRIGVTGHRSIPQELLAHVRERLRAVLRGHEGPMEALSSLADGADQLFAALVLALRLGGHSRFTRRVGSVVLEGAVLEVDLLITELPVPLERGDVDHDFRVGGQVQHLLLHDHGEIEQHRDDQERRDGEHQLERHVVAELAGQFGVAVFEGMREQGWLAARDDGGFVITDRGTQALGELGLDGAAWQRRSQGGAGRVAYGCIDWSERREHLAGPFAVALKQRFVEQGWVRARSGERALELTPAGRKALGAWVRPAG